MSRFSDNLKNHPVSLVSRGDVSLEMEKAFKAMPNGENIKANKILEINTNHAVYNKLMDLYKDKKNVAEAIINAYRPDNITEFMENNI